MNRIYKKSPLLALVVVILLSYGFIALYGYYMKNPPEYKQGFTPKDFEVPLPKYQVEFKQKQKINRLPQFDGWFEMRSRMYDVPLSYNYIEYEYLGMYFVTAYCPEECGYNGSNFPKGWTTASDTICHYSDDWKTPTTCAIDRNYFGFGEYLMIGHPDSKDKKIYVTEDTGAFRGRWIDCFVETMYEVDTWATGYYPVYSVEFKTKTINSKGWFYQYESITSDLFCGGGVDWYVFWSGT